MRKETAYSANEVDRLKAFRMQAVLTIVILMFGVFVVVAQYL